MKSQKVISSESFEGEFFCVAGVEVVECGDGVGFRPDTDVTPAGKG